MLKLLLEQILSIWIHQNKVVLFLKKKENLLSLKKKKAENNQVSNCWWIALVNYEMFPTFILPSICIWALARPWSFKEDPITQSSLQLDAIMRQRSSESSLSEGDICHFQVCSLNYWAWNALADFQDPAAARRWGGRKLLESERQRHLLKMWRHPDQDLLFLSCYLREKWPSNAFVPHFPSHPWYIFL